MKGIILCAGLMALGHPLFPEWVIATPLLAVGGVMAGIGILLTDPGRRRATRDGRVAIACWVIAAALHPTAFWITAALPVWRRATLPRASWVAWGILVTAAISMVMQGATESIRLRFDELGVFQLHIALNLPAVAVVRTGTPWDFPYLAVPFAIPSPAALVFGTLALVFLVVGLVQPSTKGLPQWMFLFGVAWASAMGATLEGPPHLAAALPLVAIALVLALGILNFTGRAILGRKAGALVPIALGLAWLLLAFPHTRDRWPLLSDPRAFLDRRLEDAYAAPLLRDAGEFHESRGQIELAILARQQFFQTFAPQGERGASGRFRLAMNLHALGRVGEARSLLAELPESFRFPISDEGTAALELLKTEQHADLYLRRGAEKAVHVPELHGALAEFAARQNRHEIAARHLQQALDQNSPALTTLQMAYEQAWRAQDRLKLETIGNLALRNFRDEPLGDICLAKASKITRDDERVLLHGKNALKKNSNLAEVHYDLGLILHGMPGRAAEAAQHYESVLRILPAHPRRVVIETWIAELKAVGN